MSNNILCEKCGEVIHAEPSDVVVNVVEEVEVVAVADPLMLEVECAIADIAHYTEMYSDAKKLKD